MKPHEKTTINIPFTRNHFTFRRSWCFSRRYS